MGPAFLIFGMPAIVGIAIALICLFSKPIDLREQVGLVNGATSTTTVNSDREGVQNQ
jgi:hypothetical protein